MQRKEHLGRGRRGQRDDNEGRSAGGGQAGAWDRERGERGEFSWGGGGEDYRGMTRGGYPDYGAGDAGWGGGYPGYGEKSKGHGWRRGAEGGGQQDRRHRFDDDYWHWRNEQLRKFDQDYEDWRNERRQKFSEDFDKWRSSRPKSAEGSRTTTQAVTKNK